VSLQYIDVSAQNPGLTGSIPNLKNVSYANFEYNMFTGTFPPLSPPNVLTFLNLATNQITGTIPDSICNYNRLVEFNIASNLLNGSIPICNWSTFTKLNNLELNNNQFRSDLPESFAYFPCLDHLYLQSNQFTGTIPATYQLLFTNHSSCQFHQLEQFFVQDNQLSGTLPNIFFNNAASNGMDLRFYNNNFSGTLPSTLCNISGTKSKYVQMGGSTVCLASPDTCRTSDDPALSTCT
jgi:hypothetical protein